MPLFQFEGQLERSEYGGVLIAAAFLAGAVLLPVYGGWFRLPAVRMDLVSGDYLVPVLAALVLGGASWLTVMSALVRRARHAGAPVSAGPVMLILLPVAAILSDFATLSGEHVSMLFDALFLLDLMLTALFMGLLGLFDVLDLTGGNRQRQPEMPPVARTGFSALAERQTRPS